MNKGTYGYLTCTVRDYKGKTGVVKVRVPSAKATIPLAGELADLIEQRSDAAVVGFGLSLDAKGGETDSGKYDRVYQRLVYLFEDENGLSHRFSIPAPRDEDVNEDQEPDSESANDVGDFMETVGWPGIVYHGGGLVSRSPRRGERATDRSAGV